MSLFETPLSTDLHVCPKCGSHKLLNRSVYEKRKIMCPPTDYNDVCCVMCEFKGKALHVANKEPVPEKHMMFAFLSG
jgi:hypothetical protein